MDSGVDVETEVFDFQILLDAVLRAFAAEAGLLDAAERRNLVGNHPGVDADHAVLQRLANAPAAADIAREEIGGETEFGIVGHGDRLFFGFKAEQRGDGAESSLAGDFHFGRYVGQHGRLEEVATALMAGAATENPRALADRIGYMRLDLAQARRIDQRALGDAGFNPGADLQGACLLGKFGSEFFVDASLDQEAVGADAGLAGVAVFGRNGAVDRSVPCTLR
eukprot:TRINITY_DN26475_c0_g1_i1.p2 TRINITY_DN26475_c0_g1~~TRINITY_DN26475_c0_g1_i1.p2  ORF type:complete len:223 (+),score=42.64 TRINITY_DN26475_c0_g1_i1:171-839(+)